MFLMDTVVVSELRKRRRDPNVLAWFRSAPIGDLFLSTVTVAEIEIGISQQQRVSPTFAAELAAWLEVTVRIYGERILPVSLPVARRWGRLAGDLGNESLDLAIAATALEHGLIVVTRNISDFAPTGVRVLNPFERH